MRKIIVTTLIATTIPLSGFAANSMCHGQSITVSGVPLSQLQMVGPAPADPTQPMSWPPTWNFWASFTQNTITENMNGGANTYKCGTPFLLTLPGAFNAIYINPQQLPNLGAANNITISKMSCSAGGGAPYYVTTTSTGATPIVAAPAGACPKGSH